MTDDMPRVRDPVETRQDVIDAAKAVPGPAFGVAEVAARLDVGEESTRRKLHALADDGLVRYNEIAGGLVFWFNGH